MDCRGLTQENRGNGGVDEHLRRDGCDGPLIATIPLAPASANSGVTRLSDSITPQQGHHDLCMTFSQNGPEPLWMLDRLTLEPAP